ncbi:MAG: GNAT family N-acetyltransferase [Rhodocyclaceae bacterium]|nr:GNAT family N-acetyltransferase [Rhodocyclaceae bacterium]MBK9625897.1 GNAT family N-acetyltransferase [Rhodocyclaceae bacterium]MBL0074620.1 GNAT family N-acetyltransferase [Rhodocyclaceae bacterium]MBP6109453.1 GNAT family N-acetyltransferase [Rhodocyclaceae bacterium]MBP6278589.1 GNAT family N-acetyltransferase [Rhodocyclaceae bacterium]
MTTTLIPIEASRFAQYRDALVRSYAEENVAAGRWPEEDAMERSAIDFATSWPQGLATPDNFLYEIHATANQAGASSCVGHLWFAVVTKNGVRGGYVYDLEVLPEFRRQGHAERAFAALEPIAEKLGLASIGLHVFAHNPGAQALYAKLGYKVTGLNMVKHL